MKLGGIKLKPDEIAKAFSGPDGERFSAILRPQQVANMLGLKVKTIYDWVSHKRLDGTFRKRGKHLLFWRDRVIDKVFNGGEWPHESREQPSIDCGENHHQDARQEEDLDS